MMMWRMAREGFPKRVTDELRPEGGDSQAKRGRNRRPAKNHVAGGGEGKDPQVAAREQSLGYLVGERDRKRQRDRERDRHTEREHWRGRQEPGARTVFVHPRSSASL